VLLQLRLASAAEHQALDGGRGQEYHNAGNGGDERDGHDQRRIDAPLGGNELVPQALSASGRVFADDGPHRLNVLVTRSEEKSAGIDAGQRSAR
jgi:hypothetical protein